ncbi:MAG: VWA domain-containing protein, partial [Proteobacteria bacterium]|nr:VWA domain-containing protein [Pseudomonadota bacterium]
FGGDRGVRLDRDIVVTWPVALPEVGASLIAARPVQHGDDLFGLVTLVPPAVEHEFHPRDLVFLIDISGSMHGRPLDQSKRAMSAIIETLGPQDRLELISFASRPKRYSKHPIAATREGKKAALAWIRKLWAGGATEMHRAVLEALSPLRQDAQRQIVLVTDGYIGFEKEIVQALLERLPPQTRLHTIGVGSAPNRSLTQAAARAGRGTELIVGLEDDADECAKRLVARTTAPLVTNLKMVGPAIKEIAPRQLPDLYAGCPAMVSVRLAPKGGAITISGETVGGVFRHRLDVPTMDLGEGPHQVAAFFGREKVEDLEMSLTSGATVRETDSMIEDVGISFQIATRLTSWVAITDETTVKSNQRTRSQTMPHEVPHGASIEGLGLRQTGQIPVTSFFSMPHRASVAGGGPVAGGPASSQDLDEVSQIRQKSHRVYPLLLALAFISVVVALLLAILLGYFL